MIEVYYNNKIVFVGTEEEAKKYCKTNKWDYTQDPSYSRYERACGIY